MINQILQNKFNQLYKFQFNKAPTMMLLMLMLMLMI